MITYEQPSVLIEGQVQVGDVLVDQLFSTNPPTFFNAPSYDSIALPKGCPVCNHGGGVGIVRAGASSPSHACVGLLAEDVNINRAGRLQTSGTLVMSDWTVITGASLLSAKAKYFLSLTLGRLTTVAPSAVGQIVQMVGTAVSSVALSIDIGPTILL